MTAAAAHPDDLPSASNAAPIADNADWSPPFNPWVTAIVATLATFMEVLDTSIANVALPHIAGNLGAGIDESTWILTSYLVSNAIVLPISAWLTSLIGRRNFYLLCVALFTASSLLCGLAPNLSTLVFFRLLQGLGGGGLQPSTQAILVDTFPPRQRGMGMAVYGMTVVVAPVIGPTLGGWITDNFSWRWIFFINVPVGIVSLLLASRIITDPPFLRRRTGPSRFRVDFMGLGLLSLALGCLQVMLDLGERRDWFSDPLIITLGVVSLLSLVFVVWWEWTSDDPIVDLKLLKDRNFALATLTMLVFGFVLFGSLVLLPLFVQQLLGYTATLSGMVLSPGGLVIMVLMPLVGFLVTRIDQRWMIVFGTLIIAYSLWLMFHHFSLEVDFRTVVISRMVQGLGLAFIFVPVNTLAYAFVPREHRNQASALISLARNVGASIGIALVSTMISRGTQIHYAHMVTRLSPTNPAFTERFADPSMPTDPQTLAILDAQVRQQAMTLSFLDQFFTLSLGVLILVPVVLSMKRPKEVHEVALE